MGQYEDERAESRKRTKLFIQLGIAVVLFFIVLAIQPFSYENVDAGNVGVKINLYGSDKGVDNVTIVTGRVWYNTWTTKIIEFPTFVQTVDYKPFIMTTKDAAEFIVDPKLNYKVNEKIVPSIYRKYRRSLPEIEVGFMKTTVYDAYRIVGNSFSSDSIMSNRETFENRVQNVLITTLNKNGFEVEQLTSAIKPPPSLRAMIDQKNTSIQARFKAENMALQARAEAEVLKAEADGQATATLVRARAESEANKLKQQTLTPMLIQQQWIEKWDGVLPATSLGANTPVIFNK